MVLLLQSQRQYVFEFDASARVTAVTMPSVARHTMFTHVSVGYIRNTYNPPESNASIIHDFSEDGRPQAVHYLGTGRRVLYKYGKLAKLSEIVYDSTAVTFGYDETAGVLKMVNLQSGGFSCTIRYRKMGPLIDKQIYRFSEEGMVNARFDYTYHDNSFRIASMKPVISETPLPVDLYRYDEISGKVILLCLLLWFICPNYKIAFQHQLYNTIDKCPGLKGAGEMKNTKIKFYNMRIFLLQKNTN